MSWSIVRKTVSNTLVLKQIEEVSVLAEILSEGRTRGRSRVWSRWIKIINSRPQSCDHHVELSFFQRTRTLIEKRFAVCRTPTD